MFGRRPLRQCINPLRTQWEAIVDLFLTGPTKTRLVASYRVAVFAAPALQAMSLAQREQPNRNLLDLGLAGGNGLMVLDRLKFNPAEDRQVAEAGGGAFAFLRQPADQDKLVERVQGALERPVRHSLVIKQCENGVSTNITKRNESLSQPASIFRGANSGRLGR